MKKFFGEFKKFITRGNVVDMAVGVIVPTDDGYKQMADVMYCVYCSALE